MTAMEPKATAMEPQATTTTKPTKTDLMKTQLSPSNKAE
ncbi:hypothetical protein STSP_31520 [Streptomyces jeddahensis]|uniref:Uncharacterized protein n=1 Tax=Streptomyces jeddahensis TaxID=1716141 RepID=A0A177HTD0_9ACTN|nr:hypothetical protein STSP_31520 [Streptomyces jeddahensis]